MGYVSSFQGISDILADEINREVADKYPSAQVIGTDLSPIQVRQRYMPTLRLSNPR